MAAGLLGWAVGLEFLRADNSPVYFGLTPSQVISLLALAAGGLLLTVRGEFLRPREVRV